MIGRAAQTTRRGPAPRNISARIALPALALLALGAAPARPDESRTVPAVAIPANPAADVGREAASIDLAWQPRLRLLSQSQYVNVIHQVFGGDIDVRVRFPPVPRVDGLLAVGAGTVLPTPGAVDQLVMMAPLISKQVVDPSRHDRIPCRPADTAKRDDTCARKFFAKAGRLLFRRPLTDNELQAAVRISGTAAGPSGGFYEGLAYGLSGLLVSPQFLFISEDVRPKKGAGGGWELDGYSKASRLSFLLWDAAPDDALLLAAQRGDLNDPVRLQRQVDRMISSSLYEDGVRAFFTDYLVLEAFSSLSKDSVIYPAYTLKVAEEAKEQVLRMVVDHLVAQKGDYRDLFTTRRIFLTSDLAVLYRLGVDRGAHGWAAYDLPDGDPRGGLLTLIGFPSQFAHAGRSSPTIRGKAIRETMLCQKVPPPPPDVDFSNFEDPTNPAATARERLKAHQENPACAGCHAITDPIGLALENFDGAGQFRRTENGVVISTAGKLDGVAFEDAVGLGKALRDNRSLKSCIVKRLYAYSVGREMNPADRDTLAGFQVIFERSGYRFEDMLRRFIFDPGFFVAKSVPLHANGTLKSAAIGGFHDQKFLADRSTPNAARRAQWGSRDRVATVPGVLAER
ncbi:MAG TPA: DUF1588 domain-containing protein [Novosphingobium sp.]|nr:DUF1588 domain-containing protein [Novosphingobium sp.]